MCGEIGLAPSEFYNLQYSELVLMLNGYRERLNKQAEWQKELAAWMLQWVLAPYAGKDNEPISMDQILGRRRRRRPVKSVPSDPAGRAQAFFAAYNAKLKQTGAQADGE